MFIDAPDLRLVHVGKQEVLDVIDSMEEEFEESLLIDNTNNYPDPYLEDDIIRSGPLPKVPNAKKNRAYKSYQAIKAGLDSHYDYLRVQKYLEENGGYTITEVSGAIVLFCRLTCR